MGGRGEKKNPKKTKPTCGGLCRDLVVGQILRVSVGGRKGG